MEEAKVLYKTKTTRAERSRSKLVPELRFKGFEGEWARKNIGKISELTSSKRVYLSDYVNIGIPFFRGKEISELKKNIVPNDILYISEKAYNEFREKYGVPQKDDILMTAVGTLGNVLRIKNDDKFYFKDGNLIWFRKISESPAFLEIILEVKKLDIEKTSIGSTQRALTMVELRKLIFPFPTLPEQKKIASFLSSVDEKIQQLTRKKELLEHYKKGVMQQLFSGKLRFKDEKGKEYEEWEEKRLGEVAVRVSRKNKENNLNVLTISAQNGLVNQLEYFNKSVSAKDVTNYYLLEKDEFAYNKSYSKGYPMGAIKRLINYDKGVVSTLYICFRFNNNVSLSFMEQYFENGYQNSEIEKVAQEGARNHGLLNIGLNDFFNINLIIPSLPEQKKIAKYLTSIDKKIETIKKEITATQGFKKGLLQQMFV